MNTRRKESVRSFAAARNTCQTCAPLGACVAFLGIEGCLPLIHGSQGCATYVRRYLISHFREPVDIASSNFSEEAAIFGGGDNLATALDNVVRQYEPAAVGVATTCLTETMGEDSAAHLDRYAARVEEGRTPVLFHAATPSYRGDHMSGFHTAVRSVVGRLAEGGDRENRINLFSGFVSCSDLRRLREVLDAYGTEYTLLPDYADRLDGPAWECVRRMNAGGTPLEAVRQTGTARATVVLGDPSSGSAEAARVLEREFGVEPLFCEYPIGVGNSDRFHSLLEACTGRARPERFNAERGRLIDAYFDAHKYLAGKRVAVCADEDLAVGLTSFLDEAGLKIVAVATGGSTHGFAERAVSAAANTSVGPEVLTAADYATFAERVRELGPDLLLGNGKAAATAEELGVPLVRCGFPVHDRFGGQRIRLLGYGGTHELLDRVVNALLEKKQADAGRRFSYL